MNSFYTSGTNTFDMTLNSITENIAKKEKPVKSKKPTISITCTCKKSQCLRGYCACFKYGQYCGPLCQCENCRNKKEYEKIRKLYHKKLEQNIVREFTILY
jgi:hypothetical protein